MKPGHQWMVRLFVLIVFSGVLSGCVSDFLNRYAETDYGPNRSTLLCHPFWDCQQGTWEQVGKFKIEAIMDYANCEQELEIYGKWLSPTVVFGMEADRCMEMKDYVLSFPNPLRH